MPKTSIHHLGVTSKPPNFYSYNPIPTLTPIPTLKVKLLSNTAKAPFRAHDTDAGFDLFCNEGIAILPGDINKVRTGIAVEIPDGYYGRIAPRSGLAAKYGVDILAGVIDSGYRGEVVVLMTSLKDVEFEKGDKIAQLVVEKILENSKVELISELDKSERGGGGFGSTGICQ